MSRESSPPLPLGANEPPSSPPLFPSMTYTKKRSRSPSLRPHNHRSSSDPFIFSSDDTPEDVENYFSPRRKKRQYTGTWNQDSGVWLPSDSSDDSLIEKLAAADTAPPLFGQVPRAAPPEQKPAAPARPVRVAEPPSTEHAVAQRKIQDCLEEGNERVDLSALQLRSISDDLLLPLNHLVRHPRIGAEVPSEDAYEAFTPSLQLYLSSNLLRGLPGAIWHLEHLSVLSLRINKLTEISPAIANLKNLKELNLAGNRLRWLPWELLQLVAPNGKLTRLSVTPNPFVRGVKGSEDFRFPEEIEQMQRIVDELKAAVDDPENAETREQNVWSLKLHQSLLRKMQEHASGESLQKVAEEDLTLESPFRQPTWKQEPIFLASTPVARMEFDGSLQRGSPPKPSATSFDVTSFPPPSVDHVPADDLPKSSSRVPSLFELSLRAASRAVSQPEVLRDLLPYDAPEPVFRALDETVRVHQSGGQQCSVCKKDYILPRAEWIEYWHYVPDSLVCSAEEAYLPFLRRACSLGCAASVCGGKL